MIKKIALSTLLISSISIANEIDDLKIQLNKMSFKITKLENQKT